jgi:putative DNA primase/helicase
LTGGERVRARRMREDFWEFDPTHKLFLVTNHKPTIRGADKGIWRRVKLVPFTVTIPGAKKDPALPEKLKAELPGILAWAVRGCLEWQRGGLAHPPEVESATAEYRAEMDTVGAFLSECCATGPDECRVRKADLYAAFASWSAKSGDAGIGRNDFNRRLAEMGYTAKRSASNGAERGTASSFCRPWTPPKAGGEPSPERTC